MDYLFPIGGDGYVKEMADDNYVGAGVDRVDHGYSS